MVLIDKSSTYFMNCFAFFFFLTVFVSFDSSYNGYNIRDGPGQKVQGRKVRANIVRRGGGEIRKTKKKMWGQ